ncbi:MAG: hypothetical protein H6834_12650 [Planctomycetes bacterium]|nr:hypothetical protein [Planctomycetota bacterium]
MFDGIAWDGRFDESVRSRRTPENREAFVELEGFATGSDPTQQPTEEQAFHHERYSAFIEHFRELQIEDVDLLLAEHDIWVIEQDQGSIAGCSCARLDVVNREGGAGYALFLDRETGALVRWVEFVSRREEWLVVADSTFSSFRPLEPGEAIPVASTSRGRRLKLDERPSFLGGAEIAQPTMPRRFHHKERWAMSLSGMDFLADVWSDGLAKVLVLQGVHVNAELEVDEGSLRVIEQGFGRSIAFQATVKGYLVILVGRGDRDQARTWFSSCL